MRPFFSVSLLLLSLLLSEQVQGIRLEKGYYMSVEQHKSIHILEKENTLTKTNNIGVTQEAVVCKDGNCSGNNRKLLSVTPSTTTTTTAKNEKNGKTKANPISNGEKGNNRSQNYGHGEEEKSSSSTVNSLSTSEEHPEYAHYPDVIDLAEMDYSPARRKTPIHN